MRFHLLVWILITFHSLYSKDEAKNAFSKGISFEENKGQIHDQNGKLRHDVLYKGCSGGLTYFFKRSGFIYQQNSGINSKEEDKNIDASKKNPENKVAIHRIELNWIDASHNAELVPAKSKPDYNNYYLESEITNVKSYEELYYKELYKGIDVKWHQINGKLKYDYLVSKGADYKQIKLQILGYEKLFIDRSGELVIETSLGKIVEQAPIVIQSGKELHAKWIIENGYVSFDIMNVDPNYDLIIDPIVRDWGTYYGGNNLEWLRSSTIDNAQNIYFSGYTDSNNNIATVGAYQTTLTPTASGFLVKLDTNGVRIWGTYYAGNAGAQLGKCTNNSNGDIFVVGITSATSGIATVGSHQPTSAGGDEGFLVKFNANGVRLWATYYGGSGDDYCQSVQLDVSNNIYIVGLTKSLNGIATAGSHLDTYAGNTDAYLAKFDSNGTRLWATYYGGTAGDNSSSCSTDVLGNVYLSGGTSSTGGISTVGAHQFSYGWGNGDGYLAKFNSNGVRQWGTYYGDLGVDDGAWCKTDPFGNIILFGSSTSSTSISTTGSYQSNYAGGGDTYIALFNGNGVRQWATYYGGSQYDSPQEIITDGLGNIFLAGYTDSPTNIATATGYQSNLLGVSDAYFAKFSNSGVIQWASYYGGSNSDYGRTMVLDIHKKFYVFGESDSPIGLSTPGCHQYVFGGGKDAFIAKFIDCPVMGLTASVSNSFVCTGASMNFSSSATTTMVINYNWQGPNTFTSATQNPSITNASVLQSGNYSVTVKNNNSGCYETKIIPVVVNPIPTISVNSGTICSGQIFTMNPTGANTYTYSNGSQTVSPVNNSTYSVSGTSTAGCTSTSVAISTVNVLPLPIVSITSTLSTPICNSNTTTLNCNGANSYLWSNTATTTVISISPSVNTTYSVTGTDAAGCTNTAVQTVSVFPISNLSVGISPNIICNGQTATLSVGGATSYAWSNGGVGSLITDSPTVTTSYTVSGIDIYGCNNSAVITLSVTDCTTLSKNQSNERNIAIYPNPTNGSIFVNVQTNSTLQTFDLLGSLVISKEIVQGKNEIDLSSLAKGIYFVRVNSILFKVIKE